MGRDSTSRVQLMGTLLGPHVTDGASAGAVIVCGGNKETLVQTRAWSHTVL